MWCLFPLGQWEGRGGGEDTILQQSNLLLGPGKTDATFSFDGVQLC